MALSINVNALLAESAVLQTQQAVIDPLPYIPTSIWGATPHSSSRTDFANAGLHSLRSSTSNRDEETAHSPAILRLDRSIKSSQEMRWLIAAACGAIASCIATPPLSISLETSWPAPPLLLEILETVYDEDPKAYFPFLQLLSSHLPSFLNASDSTTLSTAVDLLTTHRILTSPSSLSTLQYALGLHTAVPKIEAFYSWYETTVNEERFGVGECRSWVEWRGKGFCEVEGLRRDMERSIEDGSLHVDTPIKTLSFDHTSPRLGDVASPSAIFYFDPESTVSSTSLLAYLEEHATSYPTFRYVVRYKPSQRAVARQEGRKTALSGYGVELALKNTDYLVVDDRATSGSAKDGSAQVPLSAGKQGNAEGPFAAVLGSEPWSELSTPLRPTEVADIGVQAASLIMASSDPLGALIELSQDFPKYSAAIARKVTVPDNIQKKIAKLAVRGEAESAVFVNGKAISVDGLNAFSLLKTIREERHLMLSLIELGFKPQQAFDLISDPLIGQAQTEEDVGEGIVDASDRTEQGDVVTWWNDIEKDKRYNGWPNHLQGLMRPLYPGQLHTIRLNMWNVILVLDLAQATSLDTITSAVAAMIQRGVPIRFGIVPMFNPSVDDLSNKMARIYRYSLQTLGRGATKEMFSEVVAQTPMNPLSPQPVNLELVRNAYERAASESKKSPLPFDQLLAEPIDDLWARKIAQYSSRLLVTKEESPLGHMFVNGKYSVFGGHWTANVQSELTSQLRFLQEQLAVGIVPDDISYFFYDLPSVPSRRSKLVVPNQVDNKLRIFNLLDLMSIDPTSLAGKLASDFVYSNDAERGAPISIWVIGDMNSADGRRVAKDALRHLQSEECSSRVGFIHVPSPSATPAGYRLSTILFHLLSISGLRMTEPGHLLSLIDELDKASDNLDDSWRAWSEHKASPPPGSPLHAFTSQGWEVADDAAAARFWMLGSEIAEKLGLRDGRPHLLVNGRLVGPLTEGNLPAEDFDVLEVYEHRKRVRPVIDLVKTMYDDMSRFNRPTLGHLISRASSILASAYKPAEAEGIFEPTRLSRNRLYEKLDEGDLSFHVGSKENALIHVAAVLDPISKPAQEWAPLLKAISEVENVALTVYLEPNTELTEVALKRFYRTSIASKPLFDVDGTSVAPPLVFTGLPGAPILTLGINAPPAWITSPKSSPYDLDNLVLISIHDAVHVQFQLKQLLVEGHAREGQSVPPRGLQLQLTKNGLEVASDTLVMANVGYLQFKVTPGVYDLSIRPGRGREVYELESVGGEGWDSLPVNETGTSVSLISFDGVTILPRFERLPGMEKEDVLLEAPVRAPSAIAGVFSRVKALVGLKSAEVAPVKTRHADINIFTVASGLLYERFASIMILSVLKHTDNTVKFWFIENFLSPSFLAFIPHMAKEYNFEYEVITYKWPHWLRAQTEKQRIIWAYKILFLDVLFPMDLDKVIFVDADQIVRADMKELVDLDLQGHVYGYAPMGNSREEMEGFRFWKTGYWKEALRGRPYHISALYVVDLKRFRQLATGDRLRGQYHALSADPNSLANLDQDLPNSMQDQIPIFTLDQDWLWCQSWCSDESLATAKTIDLCQNPMTKEPKLVRARQIPEWDSYDQEIARFAAKLSAEEGVVAASVDDLAADKGVAPGQAVEEAELTEEGSRISDEL